MSKYREEILVLAKDQYLQVSDTRLVDRPNGCNDGFDDGIEFCLEHLEKKLKELNKSGSFN